MTTDSNTDDSPVDDRSTEANDSEIPDEREDDDSLSSSAPSRGDAGVTSRMKERLREALDEERDPRTAERLRPEESDPGGGLFGQRNYTQDLVDFEFVFEAEDRYLPRTVNSGGIVATKDEFVGIARVEPRNWSIHTAEKKEDIIHTYQSAFLSTLDFHVQIVCYPKQFDISEHIEKFEERIEEMGNAEDEHELLTIGRELYPVWLNDYIQQNQMKQREFYVIVRVDPNRLREFDENRSLGDVLIERAGAIEPLVEVYRGLIGNQEGNSGNDNRERAIRVVNQRLNQVEGALQRLDVGVERIQSRDEALSLLYHYYNNFKPRRESFDVGTRSKALDPKQTFSTSDGIGRNISNVNAGGSP